ncbi:MAG: aminotransferase class I/II-fold pyridoxal phosphate-dependent enzyme [Heliobacteriaceae bacterium]|nr:aminotransferase class I/II-fold pyridoxal phosphate-dependent enzyme [Heliobacteriaceae bacterium]
MGTGFPGRSYGHGGDVWSVAGATTGRTTADLLDLSANINFLGLSPVVQQAIVAAVDQIVHYPDHRCRQLLAALAGHLQVMPEAICAGNGAVDLLDHWLQVVRAEKVLICEPAFGQYHRAVGAQGGRVVRLALPESRDFRLEIALWREALVNSGCDTAIMCSPHNPAGWTWTKAERNAVLAVAGANHVNLLVDESFLDFVPDGRRQSCCLEAAEQAQVAVLYSLTKFFAFPGIRLGALITHPTVIRCINEKRDPWSVNHLAQVAGVAALADVGYQEQTRKQTAPERDYLCTRLQDIGMRPLPATANFVLVNVQNSTLNATEWTQRLLGKGILVRNCNTFALLGERYLRLAVRESRATDRLVTAMQAILDEEGKR